MKSIPKRRFLLLGGIFGAGVATVVVSAFTLLASTGVAASQAKPQNVTPPSISGTPQQGKTLKGDRGDWTNKPTDFAYRWFRCGPQGGNCVAISGATATSYPLTADDVGHTIRFRVIASNKDGDTTIASAPTAVIQKGGAPTPPTPPSNGCPAGNPKAIEKMSLPTKLVIDRFESNPRVLTSGTQSFQLRVHITSTQPCGGDVQGALVYGTGTPFNQFTIEEQPTDSTGWASLTFQRLSNFPVNNKQGILAMFLRARKSGENVLGGVTGYRLVSVDVNLHQ
jgi:hypothetical protein